VNATGAGCAAGVATDPTIGNIQSAGLPLPPAQVNWNQSSSLYGGNIYPSSTDTSVLKCGNQPASAQFRRPTRILRTPMSSAGLWECSVR